MNETKDSLTAADRQQIAQDFSAAVAGQLDQSLIDETTELLTSSKVHAYRANGSIVGGLVYVKVQVAILDHRTFNGHAWGAFPSAGAGALFGHVYTPDLEKLYRETHSINVNATPVYANVVFFDKHSHSLGSFQAGGVSTLIGSGGGSGKW